MDLMCESSTKIAFMFTMYFVGNVVGGCLAFLPDRIGRKNSVIFGLIMSLITQTVMLFVPTILVRSIGFFFIGFSNMKNSQSYVWASEVVPFNRRSKAFTLINVADALPPTITGLFYLLVSRNWFTIYFISVVISYSALLFAFICPNSPRWLLVNDKQDEAIQALNCIAKFNGSPVRISENTVF